MRKRDIKFRAWNALKKCIEFDVYKEWNILMQYTGLKDKHGKEIYEGDIIIFNNGQIGEVYWSNEDLTYLVMWKNEMYASYLNKCKNTKVCGNIYENQELLREN